MDHMLSSAQYGPSVRNVFVGILRSMSNYNFGAALQFGENYVGEIPDERGIRTLIQLHGKSGNFSRPIELLKLMPKSRLTINHFLSTSPHLISSSQEIKKIYSSANTPKEDKRSKHVCVKRG